MGKKLGFGLSEQEQVDRARSRRMGRGRTTPQEQLERVSGRLNRQGQYGEYDIEGPGAARYVNQYAAQERAAGGMNLQGRGRQELTEGEIRRMLDTTSIREIDNINKNIMTSGKPLQEWTSDEVKEMQRNLNAGGYVDAKGEQLKVDGMVGAKTVAAMRNVQQADFGADMGPRGDYSEQRSGIGAGEVAIAGGARGGIYDTGTEEKYIPGGTATPEDFDLSLLDALKGVGRSYQDYAKGEQGWIPDLWQELWRERKKPSFVNPAGLSGMKPGGGWGEFSQSGPPGGWAGTGGFSPRRPRE
jgi:hypothetical protein